MISTKTLEPQWINGVSGKLQKADKNFVEKVIRALLLLEGLAESGMKFVFKGGTAVMLMQGTVRRFSIDIDIVMTETKDTKAFFDRIAQEKGFLGFVETTRKKESAIQKFHYKFIYNPIVPVGIIQDNVLLDVVVEPNSYQDLKDMEINSPFVFQEGPPIKVKVPSIDDITGDKLTAFAPNTTGIPYQKGGYGRGLEIIKQLYDIGTLFESINDINVLRKTFLSTMVKQLAYRSLPPDESVVYNDIFQTALCLSTRGKQGNGNFPELQQGILRIKPYIFSEKYQIEKAIIHASRVAYLTKLIEAKQSVIERFIDPAQIKEELIARAELSALNKLKKSNPEAFYYWHKYSLLVS